MEGRQAVNLPISLVGILGDRRPDDTTTRAPRFVAASVAAGRELIGPRAVFSGQILSRSPRQLPRIAFDLVGVKMLVGCLKDARWVGLLCLRRGGKTSLWG